MTKPITVLILHGGELAPLLKETLKTKGFYAVDVPNHDWAMSYLSQFKDSVAAILIESIRTIPPVAESVGLLKEQAPHVKVVVHTGDPLFNIRYHSIPGVDKVVSKFEPSSVLFKTLEELLQ